MPKRGDKILKPKTFKTNPQSISSEMEIGNKIVKLATRAANNDTVINVSLGGLFLVLGIRSMNQQKDIEALESEKNSLIKANKDLKKTMWDWKQQLYAEAETDSALVPLARLKTIYGDIPTSPIGNVVKEGASSSGSNFVI